MLLAFTVSSEQTGRRHSETNHATYVLPGNLHCPRYHGTQAQDLGSWLQIVEPGLRLRHRTLAINAKDFLEQIPHHFHTFSHCILNNDLSRSSSSNPLLLIITGRSFAAHFGASTSHSFSFPFSAFFIHHNDDSN